MHDLDLLSVLVRAAILSFEALLLGGLAYLLIVARPAGASAAVDSFCRRGIRAAALAMCVAQAAYLAISSAELMSGLGPGLGFRDVAATGFFIAGCTAIAVSIAIWFCAGSAYGKAFPFTVPLGLILLACSVSGSHAAARLDHRALIGILTALHHLGTAAWIGAMPFLLLSLKHAESVDEARSLAHRFSWMAIAGAAALLLAGVGLAIYYVGSWRGFYDTTYGVLLLAKIYLFLLLATLGAGNWLIVRRLRERPAPLLARLRRFAEAEIGLGFTAVLAAASLTAQPAAVDVPAVDRPSLREVDARMRPELPRMTTPAASQLTPATSMAVAIRDSQFQPLAASDANDRAWSEYNHHWAGIIVLLAGLLAWLSRVKGMEWARFWPLSFAGLAVFIVLRADPETWPLGPRPFWESFSAADVLEHRAAALLILCFAAFECAVQARRLHARWAAMIFPGMCALGAAILLTHDHAVQDVKEELFPAMSHTLIALFGATAGWGRWLELRLPEGRASKIAGDLWPIFLAAAGLVLLNYREM